MTRDNHPKERQKQDLERRKKLRASYDRILIVTEGRKTEPLYLADIRRAYRLNNANILVRPSEIGTNPKQVVSYAKQLFEDGDRHRKIQPRAFDRVYAVFDRDEHDNYDDALKQAESLNGKMRNDEKQRVKFEAIVSVPCFELWLLLHFEDVQAPVRRDVVFKRLKRHIPNYEKGAENIFQITSSKLNCAIQRAEELSSQYTAYDAPESYTGMGDLVKMLILLVDN